MLYMLGQAIIDIKNDSSVKYLIKIGLSRQLNQRIYSYKSDNPSALLIATTAGTESAEKSYHYLLSKQGHCYQGEWYEVNKQFFDNCLKNGFMALPKPITRQTMMC